MTFSFLKDNSRAIFFLMLTLFVTSCATPVSIKLQPTLSTNQSDAAFTGKTVWTISSQDLRIAQYLIEVIKGDGAATLINASQNSRLVVEDALYHAWQKHGLKFHSNSRNIINIQLIKLLTSINQGAVSHDIDANIIIKVGLENENKTFSKIFHSRFTQKGPFSANIEKTAINLNSQLSQLIDEILQDPELNAKLDQF